MLSVPLAATPNQTVNVVLNNQQCTIHVYQKFFGLFMDLSVNNVPLIQGVICQNQNFIVRSFYIGFLGDFMFFDTQGTSDPDYNGLAGRFLLVYLFPSELPEDYGLNPFDPDFQIDLSDFVTAFPDANLNPFIVQEGQG